MYPPYDTDTDTAANPDADRPVTLDRREGPYGEVVLRRRGGGGSGPDADGQNAGGPHATAPVFEIIANGCFLMDTSDGRSERLLIRAALNALPAARQAPALLIGGLGVGFSLAEAAAEPRWGRIAVVEREEAVIDWHRTGPLGRISAAALADPRTEVIRADLVSHLHAGVSHPDTGVSHPHTATASAPYDALCLDIDNGPDWTVTEDNDSLYSPAGLAACRASLSPGGVLAVWSAQPSPAFEESLRNAGFTGVRTEEISVARGVPDVVHLAIRGS
ncbi:spermidine synthase [Streptomyces sp. ME19-01-6]|uniref:spermidine synthase n=1 Tax=Streptomyces sp. ME19-01-6 TaxID=3028686 RepID=UPI0029A1E1F2|nr:spermidine synthase [Streptomyces sp. ME19-01-6]MDX3225591.1 spermidine synthase [Streptomyces sp. ME19-01-6]